MISERVTAEQLDRVERTLGFRPTPTPINQARQRAKELQGLVDIKSRRLTRDLTIEEHRWIRNERAMVRWDFRYPCPRYYKILDFTGNLIPFEPNIAQRMKLDTWAEHEELGIAVLELDLKARQLGISTLCELYVQWRTANHPHTNSVIASADPGKSAKMSLMMERCWQNLPFFLLPKLTVYNVGEYMAFGGLDSSITVEWLNQTSGIGRGSTPLVAHLSECSECQRPKDIIEAPLKWAMHHSKWMWQVLESTANGKDGIGRWWYDQWQFAKRNWPLGRSDRRPTFLPWYVGTDIWPDQGWLRAHPVPRDWEPAELTRRHAGRAKEFVGRYDLLLKHLGSTWEMPREQMWFWEFEREQARVKKELNKFYQELCADDEEAFQHRHDSIFDAETISIYRSNVREPKGVYGLVGNDRDLPLRLQPDDTQIDKSKPRLPIKTGAGVKYDLVPLRRNPDGLDDPEGKIFIYEWPQSQQTYGLGADTGYGIGADRSALELLKKATLDTNSRQVAEFASSECSASDLTPFAYALGNLYTVKVGEDMRMPKLVVEVAANGETTQMALRKLGWDGPIHSWQGSYTRKRLDESKATRYGVFSVAWARSQVLDWLIKACRDYFVDIDSPWLIDEMSELCKDPQKQKIEAALGGHDDRLMALGWVFWSLHIRDREGPIPMFGQRRVLPSEHKQEWPEYDNGLQERDLPLDAEVRTFMLPGEWE